MVFAVPGPLCGYEAILGPNYDAIEFILDDSDNWVSLKVDGQGYLTINEDPNDPEALGPRVITTGGAFEGIAVPANNMHRCTLRFGDGNDQLKHCRFSPWKVWVIVGGPGDDDIKVPAGIATAYVFGQDGADKINGEHNRNNLFYGGPGDDIIWGGSDGFNILDGGQGRNKVYGFQHITQCPCNQPTVFVHNQGARDSFTDFWGDSTYVLQPNESGQVGTLDISESGTGMDVLKKSGVDFEVVNGTQIQSSIVTGSVTNFSSIEVVIEE